MALSVRPPTTATAAPALSGSTRACPLPHTAFSALPVVSTLAPLPTVLHACEGGTRDRTIHHLRHALTAHQESLCPHPLLRPAATSARTPANLATDSKARVAILVLVETSAQDGQEHRTRQMARWVSIAGRQQRTMPHVSCVQLEDSRLDRVLATPTGSTNARQWTFRRVRRVVDSIEMVTAVTKVCLVRL